MGNTSRSTRSYLVCYTKTMKKKNKIFYYLSWLTILTALGLLFTMFYWLFCPYEPITFEKELLQILTEEVKRGEHVTYIISYCKTNDVQPEVSISFNDGIIYNVPKAIATFKGKGCYCHKIQIYVPKALPIGTYTLSINYRYKVNPIKYITSNVISEPFKVK